MKGITTQIQLIDRHQIPVGRLGITPFKMCIVDDLEFLPIRVAVTASSHGYTFGEGCFLLFLLATGDSIPLVGLDTRHGWRIRHPQAVIVDTGKVPSNFSMLAFARQARQFVGAWIGRQRKGPRRAFLCPRSLATTQSALCYTGTRAPLMYPFSTTLHSITGRFLSTSLTTPRFNSKGGCQHA